MNEYPSPTEAKPLEPDVNQPESKAPASPSEQPSAVGINNEESKLDITPEEFGQLRQEGQTHIDPMGRVRSITAIEGVDPGESLRNIREWQAPSSQAERLGKWLMRMNSRIVKLIGAKSTDPDAEKKAKILYKHLLAHQDIVGNVSISMMGTATDNDEKTLDVVEKRIPLLLNQLLKTFPDAATPGAGIHTLDKDARRKVINLSRLTDAVNHISDTAFQKRFSSKPDALRYVGGLIQLYAEIETIIDEAESKNIDSLAGINIKKLKSDYLAARKRFGLATPDVTSVYLERLRTQPLIDLIKAWFTKDIEGAGEGRQALVFAMNEKLLSIRSEFIKHAIKKGRTEDFGDKQWANFVELYDLSYIMMDFGVMRAEALNTTQLTAKHEKILGQAAIDKAMKFNADYNKNPLVRSVGVDPGEMAPLVYHLPLMNPVPDVGIIQKIVYACYQEMRKKAEVKENAPTPEEMTGRAKTSKYSRNKGFSTGLPGEMVNMVSEQNELILWNGEPVHIGIKEELDMFPPDARETLKFFATVKGSRDDIGSKAGMWHLGRNKGAFKYVDGADGKPVGVLSGILYQVGKNNARDFHAALLHIVDPTEMETMEDGKPPSVNDIHNYEKWPRNSANAEVVRLMTELRIIRHYIHPQWPKWDEDEEAKAKFKRYVPKKWYHDFPALDEFFNQGQDALTPGDYLKSKNAFLKIVEMSLASELVNLSSVTEDLREKLTVQMKDFNSEIGKVLAYIGPWGAKSEYTHVHEFILAAYQYFISNHLMAVPGTIPLVSLNGLRTMEYDELYKVAMNTIESVINSNSTLSKGYHYFITGLNKEDPPGVFLNKPDGETREPTNFIREAPLKKIWRDQNKLRNEAQSWKLEHDPAYKRQSTGEELSLPKRAAVLQAQPRNPLNLAKGWKSSYEEPTLEKT